MSIINLKEGKLYQWDTGIKVVVSLPIDTVVKRVDFKSKAIKGIMSMKAIAENRKYVSEIPNEMLQHSEEITAYVVISHSGDEERTIFHRSFTVKPKDKPPGYVCDQQEILRFESLEARLEALENGATNVDEKINEALKKAKESGEFDGADGKTAYQYAKDGGYTGTEEEFAQKMAKELPTKLSDLKNDSSFVKNTDYASAATAGVMKVNIGPGSGLDLENGEKLKLVGAGQKSITERYGDAPITPSNLDYAVRAGLSANRLEWTEQQKQSARDLIGASDTGVEITDGEPTKASTVLTVNPNAEEVNLCTEEDFNAFKEEIDAKFDAFINAEEVSY